MGILIQKSVKNSKIIKLDESMDYSRIHEILGYNTDSTLSISSGVTIDIEVLQVAYSKGIYLIEYVEKNAGNVKQF
jgi:hypothetical protein